MNPTTLKATATFRETFQPKLPGPFGERASQLPSDKPRMRSSVASVAAPE
jgi:hypothetical protein